MGRLIDADALLKDKVFLCGGFASDYCQGYFDALNAVEKVINDAPAVDAVPVVHGEWIAQDERLTKFMCSVCKGENHSGHEKFCPNCGSKMKG